MDRLHKLIATYFSQGEIKELADALGIYVDQAAPTSMALELYKAASRRLRLDALYVLINRRRPELDLRPYLYELIAASLNEEEMKSLCRELGLDRQDLGFDQKGLLGWDYDDYIKRTKSKELQDYLVEQGKGAELLAAIQRDHPNLKLGAFVEPRLVESAGDSPPPMVGEKAEDRSAQTVHYHIAGDYVKGQKVADEVHGDKIGADKIGGDKVGADKIGGDKAGRDIIKGDISLSATGGSAVSLTGDASVTSQAEITRAELTALIQTIVQEFEAFKTELAEVDAQDVAKDLDDIKQIAAQPQPNGRRLARMLANVSAIVEVAGGEADAAGQLLPHLRQAIEKANNVFGN